MRFAAPSIACPSWAVVLAALALTVATACDRGAEASKPTEPQPVVVSLVAPEERELPRSLRVTGSLFGDEQATVAAKVQGRVVAVMKDLGDTVTPGEPLLAIEATDYELARAERARAFAEALSRLGRKDAPPAGFDVEKLPGVARARAQAANAKARFERAEQLAKRQPPLISPQDLADVRTAWDVAEGDVQVERLAAAAQVAEALTLEAQLRIAEQRLADTVHHAPATSGAGDTTATPPGDERRYAIASRKVSVGDFVQVGTPLFELVDADPVKLRAAVPERRLGDVRGGEAATVSIDAFPTPFEGHVSRVSPAVDVSTRSFAVEIVIPNPALRLKPGSFASAEIAVGSVRGLVVPRSAVTSFAGVHKVLVEKNGKVEERAVALGQPLDDRVEIVSGLGLDDRIVAQPSAQLRAGLPIVADTQASAAASPGTAR